MFEQLKNYCVDEDLSVTMNLNLQPGTFLDDGIRGLAKRYTKCVDYCEKCYILHWSQTVVHEVIKHIRTKFNENKL